MELSLNNGITTLVDDEDAELISAYKWYATYSRRGQCYYVMTSINKKTVYLHRLLTGAKAGEVVDHQNRNTLDNRKQNLRLTTHQNNCFNQRGKGSNTGFKGVSYSKERQKYFASIMHNGRTIPLGRYITPLEAAKAYNEAATRLFGEFALLNPLS